MAGGPYLPNNSSAQYKANDAILIPFSISVKDKP